MSASDLILVIARIDLDLYPYISDTPILKHWRPPNEQNDWQTGVNVIITTRKRSLRRLCFYTCLSVILFMGRVSESDTMSGSRIPPRADTPCAVHAGRYGQQASGTHPTGMHTCSNCTFERKIKTSLCGILGWKHTRIFLQNSSCRKLHYRNYNSLKVTFVQYVTTPVSRTTTYCWRSFFSNTLNNTIHAYNPFVNNILLWWSSWKLPR